MHDLAFADATRPAPVSILGLRLRAYSVGAELLLTGTRNPLVLDPWHVVELPEMVIAAAVREAVFYSSMTWTEAGSPPDRLLPLLWYRFHLKLTTAIWTRQMFGWIRRRQPDYAAAAGAWLGYRFAGCLVPPSPDPEAERIQEDANGGGEDRQTGRGLGAPHLARLVTYLITEQRYAALGYATPWDVPYGLASYLHTAEMEEQGRMKVENADEAELKAQLAAMRAEFAAEQAKAKTTDA